MPLGSQNARFKRTGIRVISMGPKGKLNKRKFYRARRYRRKLINLSQQVVPIVGFKKMRYHETIALSITNAFQAQAIFSLNGLYDPNISGGGHQPLGFDQMMGLYNKYCVLGAKVSILGRPGSTGNTYPMNLIVEQNQLSSMQYSTPSQPWEKNTAKILTFNSSYQNVYTPSQQVKLNFSAKKTFRTKDRGGLISGGEYNGTSSANPSSEQRLFITYQGQGLQQTTASLYVDVTIEYIVAFHDRKQLLQS